MTFKEVFLYIDNALIRHVFQKVSDVSASVIGKSNFWLSKIFGWLFLFFLTGHVVFTDYSKHSYAVSAIWWIMMTYWTYLHHYFMSREDASYRNRTKATLNPLQSEMMCIIRAAFFVFVFLTLPSDIQSAMIEKIPREWLYLLEEIFFVLTLYFAACQPPPPHLLKSFWERFQTKSTVPGPA
jgi:hypothetical protein